MICEHCEGRKKISFGGIFTTCPTCDGLGHVLVKIESDFTGDKRSKEYRELKKKEG